jgi:hypothetical protein
VERIVEQGNKPEPQVERTSRFVNGVDLDRSNPNLLGQILGAFQRIDQEQ